MAAKRSKRDSGSSNLVPEPRERRRTSAGYVLFSLFVTLLGVAVTLGAVFVYGHREMRADGPLTAPKAVTIKSGERSASIAAKLEREGVISNQQVFYIVSAVYQRMGISLKAGEYQFSPGDSMQAVFDKISEGKALSHKVTIPEGWTTMQALQRISDHPLLSGDVPDSLPEGVLLPDTYSVQRGDTRQSVIDRMRQAQKTLVNKLWAERDENLPIKTIEEALILASIVEKETGVAAERGRVAAVFINRLRRNMRLQSDPTIIYGIVGGKGKLGRPIRRSEIDAKTPYNTYQINGLPPTPIANPGRAAIAAVLQPDASQDLYFVADGTGGHAFSKTLAEHEVNVKRYRQIERQRRIAAAAAAKQAAAAAEQAEQSAIESAPAAEAKPEAETAAAVEAGDSTASSGTTSGAGEELPVSDSNVAQSDTAASEETARTSANGIPLPRRKPVLN